jgi:transposase
MGKRLVIIVLSAEERSSLESLVSKGKHSVRKVNRARVLLELEKGVQHQAVAEHVGVSLATVYNVHGRFLEQRLASLEEQARSGQPRKVTPEMEAAVTRIACSEAPDGRSRWTVSLINERIVELGFQVHDESVRLALKKANSNPGSESSGASAK